MNTLEEYVRHHAQTIPDKIAIQSQESKISYGELWIAVCAMADSLKESNVLAYVIRAGHSIDFVIAYLAAHKAGKVVVPLEKNLPNAQFKEIEKLVSTAPMPVSVSDVLFTTGTTGKQKGSMISQEVILSNAENLIDAQGFSSDLTFIATGPLNHIGSLSKIWPSLVVGATVFIMDGIKDLGAFFSVVKNSRTKVATFQVPASLRIMLQLGEAQLRENADKFDFVETGAAPMAQADMDALCRLLPNTRLYNTYASTETGIIATHDFNAGYCMTGCLGRPMKHSSLTIDANGFITCQGKTIMLGYCGDKEETDRILFANAIHTKDKGILDLEGRLQLSGRDGDIINVGGFKVNPVEVEDAAMSMPEIADCICIPSTHPVLGTALRLLYIVKENHSLEKKKLALFLTEKLESYKIPQFFSQVDKIERTYNGKLNRKAYVMPSV